MKKGFTLLEILLVIGIIAVLAAVAVAALNPFKRFAQANNSKRLGDITAIMDAIQQKIIDNNGVFATSSPACPDPLPTTASVIASSTTETASQYDICGCLLPKYMPKLGVDPQTGFPKNGLASCGSDYNTRYQIVYDPNANQITITALDAQDIDGQPVTIEVTR